MAAAAWGAVCTQIWWCPSYLVYSYLLLQSNELAHLTYSFYYSFLMNFEIRFSNYVSGSDHFFTSISFFKSNELPHPIYFTLNSSYWQKLCSVVWTAIQWEHCWNSRSFKEAVETSYEQQCSRNIDETEKTSKEQ